MYPMPGGLCSLSALIRSLCFSKCNAFWPLDACCVQDYDSLVNSLCLATLVRADEPLYKLLGGIQTIHDPE